MMYTHLTLLSPQHRTKSQRCTPPLGMVFYVLILSPFPPSFRPSVPPSLHCSRLSPLLIQSLYLFLAFVADGIAEVVPEGGVELGVITLSSFGSFDQSNQSPPKIKPANFLNRKRPYIYRRVGKVFVFLTYLDAPALVMDIMKRRILFIAPLQRVPW